MDLRKLFFLGKCFEELSRCSVMKDLLNNSGISEAVRGRLRLDILGLCFAGSGRSHALRYLFCDRTNDGSAKIFRLAIRVNAGEIDFNFYILMSG
jgi:hypothetical protein